MDGGGSGSGERRPGGPGCVGSGMEEWVGCGVGSFPSSHQSLVPTGEGERRGSLDPSPPANSPIPHLLPSLLAILAKHHIKQPAVPALAYATPKVKDSSNPQTLGLYCSR